MWCQVGDIRLISHVSIKKLVKSEIAMKHGRFTG
jgi:hypothetical protein